MRLWWNWYTQQTYDIEQYIGNGVYEWCKFGEWVAMTSPKRISNL